MEAVQERSGSTRSKSIIKVLILIGFIAGAIALVKFTPVRAYLNREQLGQFLDTAGIWAPLVFIAIYAAGTLLTGLGGAIFGPYWGFVYVWFGAMIGAAAAFVIGRTLGREFAASLIGNRLKKYDDAIERNGFATVLYLRLVYFPFTPMNFGMGLTRVRFRDYIAGTGLGIVVGTFVFTFFVGTLKNVIASGNWAQMLSFEVFFSVALFVFSFFIPTLVKRIRGPQPSAAE